MAYRRQLISPNEVYHVFNRSVAHEKIFLNIRDHQRFCETLDFYRFLSPGIRFSYYDRFGIDQRKTFLDKLYKEGQKQVSIFSFCLMPDHFHFLVKELVEKGIFKFISNLQNSYAKYFNTKVKRSGSLFQEMFKAVHLESDGRFLHVARYIHLNPYSSLVTRNVDQLLNYPWSSLPVYLNRVNFEFVERDFLYSFYSSQEQFKDFTLDQADYQRELNEIKHLTIDE